MTGDMVKRLTKTDQMVKILFVLPSTQIRMLAQILTNSKLILHKVNSVHYLPSICIKSGLFNI